MSYHLPGYPWPSLAPPPYRSSLLAGRQGYIPYPYRAAVCRFELVARLLLGHVRGSIGEHYLWAHFCFELGKKCHRNVWNASDCFSTILHESSISFLTGIRDSRNAGSLWGMMRGMRGVWKSIHQSWSAKGLGLGLLCWGFKGVQEEIPSEETSTLQIGSVAFPAGQYTSPQLVHNLSQTIWSRLAPRQFLSLPTIQTLLPMTFGYSLSSQAVVMRQLRRWKRLWRRSLTRSHKRTSTRPSWSCWNGTTSALQPEEITSKGTRVSCVYYQ